MFLSLKLAAYLSMNAVFTSTLSQLSSGGIPPVKLCVLGIIMWTEHEAEKRVANLFVDRSVI